MKKIISLLALLSIFSISVFAQETEASPLETTEEQPSEKSEKSEKSDFSDEEKSNNKEIKAKRSEVPVDFIISMAPALIINTGNHENSAVSPIVYPFSFGVKFFKNNTINFEPRLSFYAGYYLWVDDAAYPAEIENRTATVFSFLLDLPVIYKKQLSKRQFLEFGFGPSANFRIAILSNGVSSSDAGTTGSAGSDTDEIRSYMWDNFNWLFVNTSVSYTIKLSEKLRLGPECRFYIPCGQLFSGNGFNSGIVTLGLKAVF